MSEVLELGGQKLPIKKIVDLAVDLTPYQERADALLAQAERAKIESADDYAKGGDLIKIAKTQATKADELRTSIVKPFNDLVRFINGQFKPISNTFDKVRSTIEPKMLSWKRAEDKRLREEAAAEAKRLEEEALAKAALESTEETQDEVLEAAAVASEKMVNKAGVGLQRGNYGSSTGTAKVYETNITNANKFLAALVLLADNGEINIADVVEFRKAGLKKLAKYMLTERTKGKGKTDSIPGAEFVESDGLRIY